MTNFITVESEYNQIKMKNLLNTGVLIGFIWLVFHFTIIFFFGMVLQSVLLVGIFLAVGNAVALLVDIPVWALQKYIKPKTFLMMANTFMVIVTLTFLKFVYFSGIEDALPWNAGFLEKWVFYVWDFLNSSFNIVLLIISACMYGLIKECYDVTTLSYTFNNTAPSEYATYISQYNIRFWIGAVLWLLASWVLLTNIQLAVSIFLWILIAFYFFLWKFFDNKTQTIDFEDVKKIRLDVISEGISKTRLELSQKLSTKNFIELSRQTKVILLKPVEIKNNIDFRDVYVTTVENVERFFLILFGKPISIVMLWISIIIMQYGFWDTFVSTFQIEFLQKMIDLNKDSFLLSRTQWLITAYMLLLILVIPAFALQDYFINLSKKIWEFKVIMFGAFISSVSLFFFGIVDKNIYLLMFFGLMNSVWYAAVMPISQAIFSDSYNLDFARKYKLTQIDTTVSAAPLKIVLNFANVIGLVFGSMIVSTLGFNRFFIVFSLFLFSLFLFSLANYKRFKLNVSSFWVENSKPDKDFS